MRSSRSFLRLLTLGGFLFAQPASAYPTVSIPVTVIDPTKRELRYDGQGNLTEELVVGTGQKTTYRYDPLARLTEVTIRRSDYRTPFRLLRWGREADPRDGRWHPPRPGVSCL